MLSNVRYAQRAQAAQSIMKTPRHVQEERIVLQVKITARCAHQATIVLRAQVPQRFASVELTVTKDQARRRPALLVLSALRAPITRSNAMLGRTLKRMHVPALPARPVAIATQWRPRLSLATRACIVLAANIDVKFVQPATNASMHPFLQLFAQLGATQGSKQQFVSRVQKDIVVLPVQRSQTSVRQAFMRVQVKAPVHLARRATSVRKEQQLKRFVQPAPTVRLKQVSAHLVQRAIHVLRVPIRL